MTGREALNTCVVKKQQKQELRAVKSKRQEETLNHGWPSLSPASVIVQGLLAAVLAARGGRPVKTAAASWILNAPAACRQQQKQQQQQQERQQQRQKIADIEHRLKAWRPCRPPDSSFLHTAKSVCRKGAIIISGLLNAVP